MTEIERASQHQTWGKEKHHILQDLIIEYKRIIALGEAQYSWRRQQVKQTKAISQ